MVTEVINNIVSPKQASGDTDNNHQLSIDDYYNEHLKPLEAEFQHKQDIVNTLVEENMPKVKRRAIAATLLFSGTWFGLAYLGLFQEIGKFYGGILLFTIALALVIWAVFPLSDHSGYEGDESDLDFEGDLAKQIFPMIFNYFGDDFVCSDTCPWEIETLSGSGIFPIHSRASTEDYLYGSYKSVEIEMVEVKLEKLNIRHKNYDTVFKGLLLLLTPKKQFSGHIVVKRDMTIAHNFGNRLRSEYEHLETVRLEDPIFESKFEVFADDQVAARTVLTTSFMQRLLNLEEKVDSDGGIECSFHAGKLQITVPTRHNYFKPISQYDDIDFKRELQRINSEVKVVFDIIDTLQLDMDIGL